MTRSAARIHRRCRRPGRARRHHRHPRQRRRRLPSRRHVPHRSRRPSRPRPTVGRRIPRHLSHATSWPAPARAPRPASIATEGPTATSGGIGRAIVTFEFGAWLPYLHSSSGNLRPVRPRGGPGRLRRRRVACSPRRPGDSPAASMNPRALAAWSFAGVTIALATGNPVYRVLVLLCALNVLVALAQARRRRCGAC